MDKEIYSWALLANQGHDIDSLKKKILCYRCKSSLKHVEEFFAYKIHVKFMYFKQQSLKEHQQIRKKYFLGIISFHTSVAIVVVEERK